MALITVEELEAFMGREFTDAEADQAEALIEAITDTIEGYTGISFELVEDEEIRSQADGYGMIELNARPVSEVIVYPKDSTDEYEGYAWDGLQAIYGLYPNEVVDIIYSHGYSTVPGDIKTVAKGIASRIMYNPSGLRQETVGAISVTYPGVGAEAGTINFSKLEMKIMNKYSAQAKSWRMDLQRRRLSSLPELTVDNDID
jgi:hypothetical protein